MFKHEKCAYWNINYYYYYCLTWVIGANTLHCITAACIKGCIAFLSFVFLCVCSSRLYHLMIGAGPPLSAEMVLPLLFLQRTHTDFRVLYLLPFLVTSSSPCVYLPFCFTGRGGSYNESVVQSSLRICCSLCSPSGGGRGSALLLPLRLFLASLLVFRLTSWWRVPGNPSSLSILGSDAVIQAAGRQAC